jgi:hypothetical protein
MDKPNRINGVTSKNSIAILMPTENGNVELLLSFIGCKNRDDFPPHIRDNAIFIEGLTEGSLWITIGITGARRIIGPLMDNVPAGESGEYVSLEETKELADEIDLTSLLTAYRTQVIDDSSIAKIIDRFLEEHS